MMLHWCTNVVLYDVQYDAVRVHLHMMLHGCTNVVLYDVQYDAVRVYLHMMLHGCTNDNVCVYMITMYFISNTR